MSSPSGPFLPRRGALHVLAPLPASSFDPAETYERLEADKKKQVHKKRKCPGPIITYHSVTVPLVGDPGPKEENVDVEG